MGVHLVVVASGRENIRPAAFPCKVCFGVASTLESKLILGDSGAEDLRSPTEMIFQYRNSTRKCRAAFVEYGVIAAYMKDLYRPDLDCSKKNQSIENDSSISTEKKTDCLDESFERAARFALEKEKMSSGMLQRLFKIPYNRALRILDQLEEAGIIGTEEGGKPRRVLVDARRLETILQGLRKR